jgi:hypothetical protein
MTEDPIKIKEGIIQRLEARLTVVNNQLDQAQAELEDLRRSYLELQIHESDLRHRWTMLNASTVVVLLKRYRRLRDRILPTGTRRRSSYNALLTFFYRILTRSGGEEEANVSADTETPLALDLLAKKPSSPGSSPSSRRTTALNLADGMGRDQRAGIATAMRASSLK